ncbi:tripartite tricarboxylate transporter substrate binding protein [Virgibacillus halodenitrificans]|uniref:Tricarboxylic transport TctC n=1 Tax=Virgibacillus halodenitrificans TaxID=1482 RepID=A0AAC9J0B8_VIRHA|nr:tripartite tricarboxylate transporter substrate binding protein [Virgibacillus halodenitrificans]APC49221.1 tricarboxylic transport TctC [Virgibacillus halodenitrificans]MCJ0930160.1 tripartite tricarboxylate transporter substrate binding protein [Virgibacillus halodenitrificans]MEC2161075.1 tripartite tricarboxylate transporter substrate binding protein [Virgibacillus halodenitrificans]WHX26659.1 tripartite tricarboxylate transporter substrate binding protein [Virgibacillus halodenitrifican
MRKLLFVFILFCFVLVTTACASESKETSGTDEKNWEPEKPIELVAPAGAGGGWDTTARMAAKVFNETGIIEQDIGVVNKPGGGGAVGWAYVAGHDASPYNLFVASPPIVLIPLNGQSEYGHEDFTPLANMIADYAAFAVAKDAKWDNLNELFEDMKKDPESITVVGTSSPGSMDHIQFVQIAKAAGVDISKIKYVSDQDGVGLTQLLNGSVDVFSTGVSETVEQVKAGTIKVLGVTSEERLEGEVLEDFPTAKEQGIDATFVNWRGFFGPPNMDENAIKYYEEKFKKLSESEEFAEIRKQYGWDEMYMNSEEYKTFLDKQKEEIKTLLDELNLSK